MNIENIFSRKEKSSLRPNAILDFNDLGYGEAIEFFNLGEISPDIVLYDSKLAEKQNSKIYRDYPNLRGKFWQIGQSGQGDFWFIRSDGKICWYDHNLGEINESNIIDFKINFSQFLDMAMLVANFEEKLDTDEDYFSDIARQQQFKNSMNSISPTLFDLYPYGYFD